MRRIARMVVRPFEQVTKVIITKWFRVPGDGALLYD
jgi:hypothetical protein